MKAARARSANRRENSQIRVLVASLQSRRNRSRPRALLRAISATSRGSAKTALFSPFIPRRKRKFSLLIANKRWTMTGANWTSRRNNLRRAKKRFSGLFFLLTKIHERHPFGRKRGEGSRRSTSKRNIKFMENRIPQKLVAEDCHSRKRGRPRQNAAFA